MDDAHKYMNKVFQIQSDTLYVVIQQCQHLASMPVSNVVWGLIVYNPITFLPSLMDIICCEYDLAASTI